MASTELPIFRVEPQDDPDTSASVLSTAVRQKGSAGRFRNFTSTSNFLSGYEIDELQATIKNARRAAKMVGSSDPEAEPAPERRGPDATCDDAT